MEQGRHGHSRHESDEIEGEESLDGSLQPNHEVKSRTKIT